MVALYDLRPGDAVGPIPKAPKPTWVTLLVVLLKQRMTIMITTMTSPGWLVGWGLTAILTQNRSYRACRFVGIFYSKL